MPKKSHHMIKVVEDDDKVHHSQFLLTINSNYAVSSPKDPFIKEWKNKVLELLQNLPDYVITNQGAIPDNQMIINIKPFFEIGEKQKRLHAHIDVTIDHNSNIKINSNKVAEDLQAYVNCQYVRGSRDREKILAYLRKQQ